MKSKPSIPARERASSHSVRGAAPRGLVRASPSAPAGGGASSRQVASASRSGTIAIAERRAAPRMHVKLDVSVGTDSHYFTAHSSDLSTGGLFVATYRALS